MLRTIKETVGWGDLISVDLGKASPVEVITEVSSND